MTFSKHQPSNDVLQSLVSGSIWFTRICAGVFLERGRQTTVGWSKMAIFSVFGRYSLECLEIRPTLLYGIIEYLIGFY